MKRVLTILGLITSLGASAQMVDGVDISKDTSIHYIQILHRYNMLNGKLTVAVDYGQKKTMDDPKVEDSNGKAIKFNSPMDFLNYFYRHGWLLVNAFSVTVQGVDSYMYLMEKRF